MKRILFALSILTTLTISSCSNNDDSVTDDSNNVNNELLLNGGFEEADKIFIEEAENWEVSIREYNPPNNYYIIRDTSLSHSGNACGKISTEELDDSEEYALFSQTIKNSDQIPITRSLIVEGYVKTENLIGNGFQIYIGAYESFTNTPSFFETTLLTTKNVSGTNDWQKYTVQMPPIPNYIENISVFLVLNEGTTGSIYFDDFSMYVKK